MTTTDKRHENAFGDRPCVDVDVDSPRHQESRRKTIQWAKDYVQSARELMASFRTPTDP